MLACSHNIAASWLNWRELWTGARHGNWPFVALFMEMFWCHSQHTCCFHLCCVQASRSGHCGLGTSDACCKSSFTVFLGPRSLESLLSTEIFLGDFPLRLFRREEGKNSDNIGQIWTMYLFQTSWESFIGGDVSIMPGASLNWPFLREEAEK